MLTSYVSFILTHIIEWDNVFYRNLGALTKPPVGWNNPAGLIRSGETDHFPSTFWITNPPNDFIDNVAAGSRSTGIWLELKLRAPSSALAINQGSNPKTNPQGKFEGNVAHSNNFRAGITTYQSGYRAPPGTTWTNIKSYKNNGGGLFQHGTNNIIMKGGLLADNAEAARNFHHEWAVYDGVEIIGRSAHAQSLIDQGRLSDGCGKAGGISLQPNEGMGVSISFYLEAEVLISDRTLSSHMFLFVNQSNSMALLSRTPSSLDLMYAQEAKTLPSGMRMIKSVMQ